MAFEFHATTFEFEQDALRLAFDDEPTGHYFLMQRSEDSTEEAVPDAGDIYLERDDQLWG